MYAYDRRQRIAAANRSILELSRAYASTREYRTQDGYIRHKCFLSYFSDDAEEVLSFVKNFEHVFIPKSVGISEDDPWVNSDDDDYVMDVIRDEYLADSTVTITLIGRCTWSRKFIDWEIYSSLRRDKNNRLNGLLAIQLPSAAASSPALPDRLDKNVIRDSSNSDIGYARYRVYPDTTSQLRRWIDDAFYARTSRDDTIVVGGPRREYNLSCS